MSPSQRCDEILHLIDETLSDHPLPSIVSAIGAKRPSADGGKSSLFARRVEGKLVEMLMGTEAVERASSDMPDSDAIRRDPDVRAPDHARLRR